MDGVEFHNIPSDFPLVIYEGFVLPDWVDSTGHMAAARYTTAFDLANRQILDFIGLGNNFQNEMRTAPCLLEMHTSFLRELGQGDPYHIAFQLLGFNTKFIRYFMFMNHGEDKFLSATAELLISNMGLENRKILPFTDPVLIKLSEIDSAQKNLPVPAQAGRSIRI